MPVAEVFDEERAALMPLPSTAFDPGSLGKPDGRQVYGLVDIDSNRYLAGPDSARSRVLAAIRWDTVTLASPATGELFAEYPRRITDGRAMWRIPRSCCPARGQTRAWRESSIRPDVPDDIRAWLDSMDEKTLRESLKAIRDACRAASSIPRCRRAARSCAQNRDMGLHADSLTPIALRMRDGEWEYPGGIEEPDLSGYDRFITGTDDGGKNGERQTRSGDPGDPTQARAVHDREKREDPEDEPQPDPDTQRARRHARRGHAQPARTSSNAGSRPNSTRAERSKRLRLLKQAGFPADKTLDGYDWTNLKMPRRLGARAAREPRLRRRMRGPRALRARRHRQNHLAIAIGRLACEQGVPGALLHRDRTAHSSAPRPAENRLDRGTREHRQGPTSHHRRVRLPAHRRGAAGSSSRSFPIPTRQGASSTPPTSNSADGDACSATRTWPPPSSTAPSTTDGSSDSRAAPTEANTPSLTK